MRKKLFVLCVIAIATALLLTACAGVDLTLTFEVDGEVYATVNTMGQETIKMPKNPEKEGYAFDGWYWDKDVWEKPFTANSLLETPLSENMIVYAKWKLKTEAHEHIYGEWEVVTPATCTAEGLQKHACTVCGEEETEAIPKLAHNYGEWTVVTPATCTAVGLQKRVCTVCGEEETEVIQRLPHTYETKHDAANHWSECSVCHETVNVTAHTFGEWIAVIPASCTAEGLQKHECACGEEETEAIPILAHNYETKNDAANHWSECSVCHETVNVTAHSFGEWIAVIPASCTAEGLQKHECACGAEETEVIPILAHNYETKHDATNHWSECSVCQDKINETAHSFGAWEVVTPATCTAAGEQKHACSCGAEETAVIPKLAHIYITKHDATNHWQECSVGHEKINVKAHSFGEWEIVTAATCTVAGEKKRACSCGEEQTEAIPTDTHNYEVKHDATDHWEECTVCQDKIYITAHTFGEWTEVTAATCTTEGLQKRTCTVCGAEEMEAIQKIAHRYETKHDETSHWLECSVCHAKVNVTAHTFGEWTEVTAATCTIEGEKKHVCTVCGEEQSETMQKLAHNYVIKYDDTNHWQECAVCHEKVNETAHTYGAWEVVTAATCTAEGIKKHICTVCEKEEMEVIPIVPHTYETKYDETNHWEECSVCHETVNVTAHTFGDWEIVIAANCTVAGQKKRTCSCGAEESEAIPKRGHSYYTRCDETKHWQECALCGEKADVTAHTYETKYDELNHWQECSVCSEAVNKEAHRYENEICTVCGRVYGTVGLAYNKIECGYAVAGIGTAEGTAIEIPSKYEGEPVIAIGSNAFYGCSSLTSSIVIPDSVTGIGSDAFSYYSNLTSIAIPDSVTSIGSDAFYGTGIWNKAADNSVVYADKWAVGYKGDKGTLSGALTLKADTVGIADSAFSWCSSLTSIAIGNGVTSIGVSAFYECSSLTSIIIPDSVTSIGSSAFKGCSSLTSIAIPDSVTSIGHQAFYECSSLTSITIPDSVTSIGEYAFNGCSSLTSIAIPNSVTSIGDRAFEGCSNLTELKMTAEVAGVYGANNVTKVVITSGTSIGTSAFSGCSNLTSIEIPDSVTSIGNYAFRWCNSLTSIAIPNSVTSIGDRAFEGCSNLTELKMTAEVAGVYGANNVTKVVITSGTSIGTSAFSGCSNLTSIEIPDSVTSIGNYAFNGCSSLTSIAIGNGVTSIGNYAFSRCSSLTSIAIPDSVTSIGDWAFSGCSNLTSIAIGNGVTSIGSDAFSWCSNLTNIAIPDSVTSIGSSAFYYCSSLTSIAIPNGVTSIGYGAFFECSSLTSIAIPDSVISIGSYAFGGCGSLTIYAEVAAKPSGWGSIGCPVVLDYKNNDVADDGYIYTIQNGIRYGIKDGAAVVAGQPSNITEANIASEIVYKETRYRVTSIGSKAFYECSSLKSIVIGNGVTSIGSSVFEGCISLETLTVAEGNTKYHSAGNCIIETETKTLILGCKTSVIPTDGSVTNIGDRAFYGCSSLQSIAIPDSVTSIGSSAFSGTGIWNNTAENSVVYADKWAVGYKGTISEVTLKADTVGIGERAFDECSSLTGIAIPDSVMSIGSYAFAYCTGLTSIKIGNGVTSIGSDAFEGCSSLTSITIPDSVTSIGDYAFYGCSSLTSIAIPDSITSIGDGAFYGCSSLTSIEFRGTKAEWKAITKGSGWNDYTGNYTVTCTDGTLSKSEA